MAYTLSHSEENKGWTSFWSYVPEWFARLGKRFYSFKSGQLWIHHDAANPLHNNFYNTQYGTSIKTVINDAVADDKAFKTIVLESDQKWNAFLATNYTESTISASEFNTRESRQFAFIRQNENADDYSGGTTQGIGVITLVEDSEITFGKAPELVNTGDMLVLVNGANQIDIGIITNVVKNVITVGTILAAPTAGYFCFAKKNARAEGGDVRGYYMEVLLTNTDTTQGELFAVSTEASKSYV